MTERSDHGGVVDGPSGRIPGGDLGGHAGEDSGSGAHAPLDERYVGPLEPDTVLPLQFFDALKRRASSGGERRLMMAILEDAVHCFRKHGASPDPRTRQLALDAEAWIRGTDRRWFFSFENVCDTLEIDPDWVREGLLGWRSASVAGGAGLSRPGELHPASGV
jgi:hypothetical protein